MTENTSSYVHDKYVFEKTTYADGHQPRIAIKKDAETGELITRGEYDQAGYQVKFVEFHPAAKPGAMQYAKTVEMRASGVLVSRKTFSSEGRPVNDAAVYGANISQVCCSWKKDNRGQVVSMKQAVPENKRSKILELAK